VVFIGTWPVAREVATPVRVVIIAPMAPRRLYCPDLTEGLNLLPPEESRHAVASLRARAGDEFLVFDGRGRDATARVEKIARRQVRVTVEHITEHPFELRHRITLAVAMTKAHRQGYLIEKCTELGVAAFWPILAERSVARPTAASTNKWSRRAIEAAKQSARAWVPTVAAPQAFAEAVARIGEFDAAAMADPEPSAVPFSQLLDQYGEGSRLLVFVGPEGGWTEDECREAVGRGAVRIGLSPTVLRAETAAVAVCAAAALHSASNDPSPRLTMPR